MSIEKSSNPLHRLLADSAIPLSRGRPAPFEPFHPNDADEKGNASDGVGAATRAQRTPHRRDPALPKHRLNTEEVSPHTPAALPRQHERTEGLMPASMETTSQMHKEPVTAVEVAENANRLSGVPADTGPSKFVETPDAGAAVLQSLSPAIERAQKFADEWPATYRSEIFRVAFAQLLAESGSFGVQAPVGPNAPGRGHMTETLRTAGAGAGAFRVGGGAGPLGPIEKLGRALGLDTDAVERTVHIDENGKVSILGRLTGKTRKELQTRYSLAYLYTKEMGLGNRLVDIEELRALCAEQGCYDQANFTSNYKRDIAAGLIREDAGKGARSRRYMLSQKGIAEGASLLRQMVEQ